MWMNWSVYVGASRSYTSYGEIVFPAEFELKRLRCERPDYIQSTQPLIIVSIWVSRRKMINNQITTARGLFKTFRRFTNWVHSNVIVAWQSCARFIIEIVCSWKKRYIHIQIKIQLANGHNRQKVESAWYHTGCNYYELDNLVAPPCPKFSENVVYVGFSIHRCFWFHKYQFSLSLWCPRLIHYTYDIASPHWTEYGLLPLEQYCYMFLLLE